MPVLCLPTMVKTSVAAAVCKIVRVYILNIRQKASSSSPSLSSSVLSLTLEPQVVLVWEAPLKSDKNLKCFWETIMAWGHSTEFPCNSTDSSKILIIIGLA